jgi:hypothetical protein
MTIYSVESYHVDNKFSCIMFYKMLHTLAITIKQSKVIPLVS